MPSTGKPEQIVPIDRIRQALAEGIIKDPRWLDSAEEPMPAWVVIDMALTLLERLEPKGESYD